MEKRAFVDRAVVCLLDLDDDDWDLTSVASSRRDQPTDRHPPSRIRSGVGVFSAVDSDMPRLHVHSMIKGEATPPYSTQIR